MRKPRFVIANKGKFGRLIPFHAEHVFAGETMKKLKASMNFMSKPIALAQSGATIDIWYYYVPLPIIWSDFPQWVMGDSTINPPYAQYANGRSLWGMTGSDDDQATGEYEHLLHEAYVKIANHYFKDDENQITTAGSPTSLPIVDQSAETTGDADLDAEDETIDVSGGTLSLKELERKRANLRYERRVEMQDGKYVNWLKNQGVNANEQLSEIPEFLGHYRRFVRPSRTVSQSTGFTVQHYGHDCSMELTKRRYFQESGLIIGVAAVRPKIHLVGGFNTSGYIYLSPERFPHVGQLAEHKKIMGVDGSSQGGRENESDNSPATYMSSDASLFKGRHEAYNTDSSYVKTHNPTSDSDAMYPTAAWDGVLETSSDDHFHMDGVMSTSLVTPLQKLLPA
jgi:hypothetical protein